MKLANRIASFAKRWGAGPVSNWTWPGYRPSEPFTGAWQRNVSCETSDLTSFSAVFACTTIIAGDIAKLPLRVMRIAEDGTKAVAWTHPYTRLFRNPNSNQTGLEFLQQMVAQLLLAGNAYALMSRDARNVVTEMRIIPAANVRVYVTEEGEAAYQVSEDVWTGVRVQEMFPARDVLHVRINTLFHPLVGVSPLYAAAISASGGQAILETGAAFFKNKAVPSGQIVSPQRLDAATAKELRETWQNNYGAGNSGKVAVMGNGLEWKPLQMAATDAQLIEQLKFSVEDVARVFRVPAFMLGDLTKVSYRNAEQLARLYYSGALQYLIENIETRLDKALDLTPDVSCEFDLADLFKLETDTRFASYTQALSAGWMSVNEVRSREGLSPVAGGELPRIQMQYVPIDQANGPPPEPVVDEAPVDDQEDETADDEEVEQ